MRRGKRGEVRKMDEHKSKETTSEKKSRSCISCALDSASCCCGVKWEVLKAAVCRLTVSDAGHGTRERRCPLRPPPFSPSCVPVGVDGCVRWFVVVDAAGGPRGGVAVGWPCRRRLLPWRAISDSASGPVPCASPRGPRAPVAGSRGV